MLKTEYFFKVANFLVSSENALRFISGGIGIFLSILFLLPIINNFLPLVTHSTFATAGVAFVGFGTGILFSSVFIWLIKKWIHTTGETKEPQIEVAQRTSRGGSISLKKVPQNDERSVRDFSEFNTASNTEKNNSKTPEDNNKEKRENRSFILRGIVASLIILVSLLTILFLHSSGDIAANDSNSAINKNVDQNNTDTNQATKQKDIIDENKIETAINKKPTELRESLRYYKANSPDIRMILRDNLESEKVGGAIAVAVTNWQFNRTKKKPVLPENLGFQRIRREDSLVERVIKKDIKIKSIKFSKIPNKDHQFKTILELHNNLKTQEVNYYLPKGQVFEVKDELLNGYAEQAKITSATKYPQNVVSSDEGSDENGDGGMETIPPMADSMIEITTFCMNKDLASPDGGEGNLTIYQIKDDSNDPDTFFKTPDDLYDLLRKKNEA